MMSVIKPLLLLFLFISTAASAKTTDKDAPLHIEADHVEMREMENISIYKGNVKITKGSLKITGDKILVKSKDGNLHKIQINGNPATFYQLNDLDQVISAESHKMNYRANNGVLELKEKALLVKDQNRFSSEHIVYDTLKDIVRAGNTSKPDTTEKPRVQITIHPEKNSSSQPK